VTLTGPGGAGKTRLALRDAEESAAEYRDGVCFVDLGALAQPALVPQTAARALGVAEQPDRPMLQTLRDSLSSKQRLLLLDNCEHLIDACACFAEELLGGCPELRILATSRQSLGITGETVWQVPPLSVPEATAAVRGAQCRTPAGALLQYEAVRLFVDRGRAVMPVFTLSAANLQATVEVCRSLDGIPLAIELAAAWLNLLTVEQIAGRLNDRFHLLTQGSRTSLPWQQTLRATMDWSYALLSESERAAFRWLSVFAGGFTLEAAETVLGEALSDDVLGLTSHLVDKSLVLRDTSSGEGRCRLLETVREYAQQRLRESGEEATVRERHYEFYARLASEAAGQLSGLEQTTWLGRLDRERDNLRAALEWSLAEECPERALRLAGALAGYWVERRHLEEGRRRLAAVLERAGPGKQSPDGAAALLGASTLALLSEDRPSSPALLDESLAIWRKLGDRSGLAAALAHTASLALYRDDYPVARSLFEQSLAIRKELDDRAGIAEVLTGLGHVARRQQGEFARALHEESLLLRRAQGDRYGVAQSLQGLGDAALGLGEVPTARACYEEALAIQRELGYAPGIAGALGQLANLSRQQGDFAAARRLREESLALWRAAGSTIAVIHSLGALGHLARDQGSFPEAGAFYTESLLLRRELHETYAIAQSLEDFAELAACERQWMRMTLSAGSGGGCAHRG
jgi:predicted ATPase